LTKSEALMPPHASVHQTVLNMFKMHSIVQYVH